MTGLVNGSVAWGDYDNDGDLDILLAGYDITSIYRNNAAIANTVPTSPTGLTANFTKNSLAFSWNAATDDETPSSGLTYNLRVGSTSGGDEIFSSMAQSDGWRKVPRLGSQNHNTEWTFDVTYPFQTSSVVYYWSVQAIDNCFAGSPFASEQVSNPVLYPCLINADEQRPTGTLLWEANSLDVIADYQVQIDDNPDFSSPEVDDNVLPPNPRITELYAGVRLNTLPDYGNLADDTVYYWRMKPNYSNGWTSVFTDGTAHFFFNMINTAPDAPISGFSPANDEAVYSLTPILSWGNASDPDFSDDSDHLKYCVEVDTTDTFVAPVYSVITVFGQPYIQIESNLLAGYRYYYRVKTVDNELAESDWSAIQQFITLMPPQNVTITRNDASVTISWDSVPYNSRGVIYTVYSSNDPNAEFPDGWAVEAVNLNTTSWSDLSTSSCSKFYRVTAGSPFPEPLPIRIGSEPACN